jgi:hypothetical protein
MKVTPPSAEPSFPTHNTDVPDAEYGERLGLKGILGAFEGTPMVPLIREALSTAGINPPQYDLEKSGHYNYYGLPTTLPNSSQRGMTMSPIAEAVHEGLDSDRISLRRVDPNTVRFVNGVEAPDVYPNLLNRLVPLNVNALHDVATDKMLAYAVPLSSDGGRPGHVILSTNQVVVEQPS